jgi:microcystin-dependent protein
MKTGTHLIVSAVFLLLLDLPCMAWAATEPFVGEIMMTGAVFCPRGWADLDGQLLPVNQNQALFSLMGTTYGGDGRTTFGLPDLRGRMPLHVGQGPGLTSRRQGQKDGEEVHALTMSEMPQHQHALNGSTVGGNSEHLTGNLLADQHKKLRIYAPAGTGPLTPLHATSVGSAGNSQAHNNMPPFLTIRFCIALQGVFPSRS